MKLVVALALALAILLAARPQQTRGLGHIAVRILDVIDKDGLYQGQTFGDETHFVCPWHGYEYDLKTGECIGDRKQKLRKYDVVKRGEDIYVVA